MRAGDIFLHLDLLLHTVEYLLERELHLYPQVGTTVHTSAALAATKASEASEASKMTTEDIAELREDVVHRHATSKSTTGSSTTHSGMTVLVITGSFVLVAQHLIRFCCFLKLLLGLLIPRILVRVKLYGLLPVGFLDLLGRSALGYLQYLVKISLCCHLIPPQSLLGTE